MKGAKEYKDDSLSLPFFTGANAPEIKPIDWIAKGLLARGAGTFIFGQPGVSKTAHSAVLCAALCLEKPFLSFAISRAYRVLYLDFDAGWNWSGQLMKAAFKGHGLEGMPDNFMYWSPLTEQCQLGQGISTNLENIGERITAVVTGNSVDVVVVDSLGQSMKTNGDIGFEAANALQSGLNSARASGAAILVIDHATKSARVSGEYVPTPSGSQQKRAWARLTIALEEEPGIGDGKHVRWSVDKTNTAGFQPFVTRLIFQNTSAGELDALKLELVGNAPERSKKVSQQDAAKEAILAMLETAKEPVRRKDFGQGGTIDRALEELLKQADIIKVKTGFYQLNPNSTRFSSSREWDGGGVFKNSSFESSTAQEVSTTFPIPSKRHGDVENVSVTDVLDRSQKLTQLSPLLGRLEGEL